MIFRFVQNCQQIIIKHFFTIKRICTHIKNVIVYRIIKYYVYILTQWYTYRYYTSIVVIYIYIYIYINYKISTLRVMNNYY
jgi:hypothetical protein